MTDWLDPPISRAKPIELSPQEKAEQEAERQANLLDLRHLASPLSIPETVGDVRGKDSSMIDAIQEFVLRCKNHDDVYGGRERPPMSSKDALTLLAFAAQNW